MRQLIASLFGILLVIIILEAVIVPGIWAPLRIDFFVGMIMGLVLWVPFDIGFAFLILGSIILQSFSCARAGYLPFVYVLTYLGLDVVRNIFYLENAVTQILFAMVFYVIGVILAEFFIDIKLSPGAWLHLLSGTLMTGLVAPLMVKLIEKLEARYGAEHT